jgi:hypothetical protein
MLANAKERISSGISIQDCDCGGHGEGIAREDFETIARAVVQSMGFDVDSGGKIYNPGESAIRVPVPRVPPAARVKVRRRK